MRPLTARPSLARSALSVIASIGVSLALVGCGDSNAVDGAVTDDLSVSLDLAAAPDLAGAADLAVPVDMAVAPDLAAPTDLATAGDLARPGDAGIFCGNTTCAPGDKCCVSSDFTTSTCAAMCQAGQIPIECEGPSSCGGDPCCVTVTDLFGARSVSGFTCGAQANSCAPVLDLVGSKITSRRCEIDADCTAGGVMTSLNKCCNGNFGGQMGKICFDPAFAGLSMGLVTCP